MTERLFVASWRTTAAILAVVGIAIAVCQPGMGAGVLIGGAWNLASLWCLSRMLHAWLGAAPSRKRAVLWLLVKFPLLYALAYALMHASVISLSGFGLGFTLVLVTLVGLMARQFQRTSRQLAGGIGGVSHVR